MGPQCLSYNFVMWCGSRMSYMSTTHWSRMSYMPTTNSNPPLHQIFQPHSPTTRSDPSTTSSITHESWTETILEDNWTSSEAMLLAPGFARLCWCCTINTTFCLIKNNSILAFESRMGYSHSKANPIHPQNPILGSDLAMRLWIWHENNLKCRSEQPWTAENLRPGQLGAPLIGLWHLLPKLVKLWGIFFFFFSFRELIWTSSYGFTESWGGPI